MAAVNGFEGLEGLIGSGGTARFAGVVRFVGFVGFVVEVFGAELVFGRSVDSSWLGGFVGVGLGGCFGLGLEAIGAGGDHVYYFV